MNIKKLEEIINKAIKMKILHVTDNLDFEGGVEIYFKEITSQLEKKGHEIYRFGFSSKKGYKNKKEFCYFKKRNCLIERITSGFFFNVPIYLKFRKWINEVNPDVIHIHHNYVATNSILLACKNIPVVKSAHDFTVVCPNGTCITKDGKVSLNCTGTKANKCLPFHHYIIYLASYPLTNFLSKKRIKIYLTGSNLLKNAIENAKIGKAEHLPFFSNATPSTNNTAKMKKGNILFIGRLVKEKGVSFLINTVPDIIKKVPDAKLTIVGDGPEKTKLVEEVKNLGLENKVTFYPSQPYHKLKYFFEKSNVLVVPSIFFEGGSLVIYDAAGYGRPVVGTRIGGIPELIEEDKTGYFVTPGNSKELADKICKIISNKKVFDSMSKNGRKKADNEFSIKTHIKHLEKVYSNIYQK